MNFRLRDKSKAKIRNYQINFAASLQIPSSNRKITDRNRPSNSPPPRSLRNNRHTIALSSPLLSSPLLSSPLLSSPARPLLPVLSCPSSPARPLLPAASPRPGPNSFRVRSDHDTHPDSSRACPTFSAPRPFPEVEPRAGIGPCRNRILAARFAPARNPIRHTTPHHTTPHHTPHHTTGPQTAYNKIPPPEIPAGVSSLSQNRHVAENPHKKCHRSSIAERRPAWRGDEHVKNDKNEASLPSLKHFKLQTLRKYLLRHCAHGAHNAPESPESAATLHTVLPCRTLPTRTHVPCNRRSLRLPSPDRHRTRP